VFTFQYQILLTTNIFLIIDYKVQYFDIIGGVMVSVLVSKAVDRGFIGGVMVNVLVSKAIDRGLIAMNPRSTAFETSTLTIMNIDKETV
jgi:hypothetical protein